MKKTYMTPSICVVASLPDTILAGSIEQTEQLSKGHQFEFPDDNDEDNSASWFSCKSIWEE